MGFKKHIHIIMFVNIYFVNHEFYHAEMFLNNIRYTSGFETQKMNLIGEKSGGKLTLTRG